jgi:hypothetical protein
MIRRTLLAIAIAASLPLVAAEGESLLDSAWPAERASLARIGSGVGVVFSPDLSVEGNCRFYEALGFACFDGADWMRVVANIHAYNREHPENAVRTLVLETHGTNGNGLKLQAGKLPEDARSYIAVAALEELLAPAGIRHLVLSACNSGRLLRPEIYRAIDRRNGDKLFLPATRGIVDASAAFDPDANDVTVITPGRSHIETTLIGALRELSLATRAEIEASARDKGLELPRQFAISEMLIRMLTRDPELELRTGVHVEDLSGVQSSPEASERIFRSFVTHLDAAAGRAAAADSVIAAAH